MNYDKFCSEILTMDTTIRFAGIYGKNGELIGGGMRENVQSLLTPEEAKMSLYHAKLRWETRKALSYKLGNEKYSMAEYEKTKLINIPLNENSLLLVSMESTGDHVRLIDNILKLIPNHSKQE